MSRTDFRETLEAMESISERSVMALLLYIEMIPSTKANGNSQKAEEDWMKSKVAITK